MNQQDDHSDAPRTGSPVTHGRRPLDGIRVVELGQLIAGPFAGQILADFGADVVKIEAPGGGDPMRRWGTLGHNDKSLSWSVLGRNKRCVTADLRSSEGRELARRLIERADVVIENFRPGTLERFGLDPNHMRADNPGVIFVRVSGYGQDGPYAHRAGYGSIGEAMGGLRYITGEPDRPPSRIGVSIGDLLAGMRAALGALMALHGRHATGRGQDVDVSIYEAVLAMSEALVPEYALAGSTRGRTGSVLPGIAPSNIYPTKAGEHVLIAANQDTVFRRLSTAMNRSDLAASDRYATHIARGQHQQELDDIISEWSVTLDAEALLGLLEANGVPAGRIYTAADMLSDPHYRARSSIVTVPDPDLDAVPMPNVTPRLSETPGYITWTGHAEDADHQSVLDEWLTPDACR